MPSFEWPRLVNVPLKLLLDLAGDRAACINLSSSNRFKEN
ncbi:hypothetical protein PLUTE_a2813 [Pseudoalteromonas luteoviolacea DSM 6061]|nr:hypothetical protein [Pseudoalteromonas luteoviolacea DSM 6061]